jgi:chemotaxis protein methyltransferase CheR
MNPALLEEFCHLITVQTGLKIRDQDRMALSKCIVNRVRELDLTRAEAYYHLLQEALSQDEQGWAKHPELQILAPAITTGESYFLRDRGQIDILENYLLPDLIQQKRDAVKNGTCIQPSLRIWSAGCSTGEEVYTLATLIQKLLPDWQSWKITILGTDLNPEAITRAKNGIYKRWSFRQTPADFRTQHFREQSEGWEVNASLRKCTLFQPMNLLQPGNWAENPYLQGMDLIICRNVFIYFQHDAIARVLQQFHAVLDPSGYLMTGHSELQGQDMGGFKTVLFPESVIYQRTVSGDARVSLPTLLHNPLPSRLSSGSTHATSGLNVSRLVHQDFRTRSIQKDDATSPIKSIHPVPAKSVKRVEFTRPFPLEETLEEGLQQVHNFLQQGRYTAMLTAIERLLMQVPHHSELYYLQAQAYANQGHLDLASAACEQSCRLNSDCLEPLYLLAQIAEEQNDLKQAKTLLRKILYLDTTAVAAYIDLGTLYVNEGEIDRAQKMFQTAWDILQSLPVDQPLQYRGAVSVRSLQNHVKNLLV